MMLDPVLLRLLARYCRGAGLPNLAKAFMTVATITEEVFAMRRRGQLEAVQRTIARLEPLIVELSERLGAHDDLLAAQALYDAQRLREKFLLLESRLRKQ